MMTRRTNALAVLLVTGIVGLWPLGGADWVTAAGEDPHAYFNALVRRNDHWKSMSFRNADELAGREFVTYDPASDTDRHRQDAGKVTIPAFFVTASLTLPVTPAETTLTLDEAYRPQYPSGRVIKIDREVMTVKTWLTDTTISVTRGTHGSTPAAHAAGAGIQHSTNSLKSQVRVPLGTEDGHDYFFVWDAYWTDSFVNAGRFNHKAFQFSSGGRDGDSIWFEPQVSYAPGGSGCYDSQQHIATFQVRSYNKAGGGASWSGTDGNTLGPGVTRSYPVSPATEYCVKPNTWNRFFVQFQQRANDYDIVNVWASDEARDPVQILKSVPVSVRTTGANPNSIAKFWIEFNSSEDELTRLDSRDLVAYVRNFAALRDSGDVRGLLVKPEAGAEPLPTGPPPPRNVRLFQR